MNQPVIPQSKLAPFNPDMGLLRAIVAAVFNRDIDSSSNLTEAEAMVSMASKLLLDMGYEQSRLQTLFREFRDELQARGAHFRQLIREYGEVEVTPLILTIIDNRYAGLVTPEGRLGNLFDFMDAKVLTKPVGKSPILQVGLTLSKLFEHAAGIHQSDWYAQSAREADGSAVPEAQVADSRMN